MGVHLAPQCTGGGELREVGAITIEHAVRELGQLSGAAVDPPIVAIATEVLPQLARGGDGQLLYGPRAV